MKNKGFTLIELLAIIVVIAIIATITTPVILNMIEKSKKEAAEQSANGFKDAIEKYYMNSSINEDEEFDLEGEYIIQDGIISGENLDNIKINVSGDIPTIGILIYEESEIKTGCLTFNEYSVYFEENKVSNVEKGECLNINT